MPPFYWTNIEINVSSICLHVQGESLRAKMRFSAFGKDFTLHLSQNHRLFSPTYVEKHYTSDDMSVTMTTANQDCFYHGVIKGDPDSVVALSTCDGIEGLVDDGNTSFYIEPLRKGDSKWRHVFYRMKDLHSNFLRIESQPISAEMSTERQSSLHGSRGIRIRRNVFKETKFVELVIVNDRSQFEANGHDIFQSNFRAKQIANLVDVMYKPLNVRVGLTAVETWNTVNMISTDSDATRYLDNFQKYRASKLLSNHPNDNAQLLTRIQFKDSVRGKAHVMSMCTWKSVGVVQDHSPNAAFTANTFAHELGHTFGMYHDNDLSNCTCNARACIMAAHVGSEPATRFSTCSRDSLRVTLERGLGSCLFNSPKMLFGGPVCGNGFVERGEECDCGTAKECNKTKDNCCDYSRCKLHTHAQCTDGECCKDCKFKRQGTTCREATNECDLPEICTGSSGVCPPDVHIYNGYPCANSTAYCFNGVCPTLDQQCRVLWGRGARSGPSFCYTYINTQTNEFGHCRQANGTYIECRKQDVYCGKLLCLSTNRLPVLGIHRRVKVFSWKISGKLTRCKSANIKMGMDITEPGIVLEGTRCGKGKICLNRRCLSLKVLEGSRPACPSNCSSQGICNNNGECHCAPPWTGLSCNKNSSVRTTTTTSNRPSTTPSPTEKHGRTSTRATSLSTKPTRDKNTTKTTQPHSVTTLVIIGVISFALVVFLGVFGFWVHRHRKIIRLKRDARGPADLASQGKKGKFSFIAKYEKGRDPGNEPNCTRSSAANPTKV